MRRYDFVPPRTILLRFVWAYKREPIQRPTIPPKIPTAAIKAIKIPYLTLLKIEVFLSIRFQKIFSS